MFYSLGAAFLYVAFPSGFVFCFLLLHLVKALPCYTELVDSCGLSFFLIISLWLATCAGCSGGLGCVSLYDRIILYILYIL